MKNDGYIFLDIEWADDRTYFKPNACSILEIGAIGYMSGKTDRYFSFVCPDDISVADERICGFLRIEREDIEKSESEKEVLEEVCRKFANYSVIVVWNRNTYDLFYEKCLKNDIDIHKYRCLILQELTAFFEKQRSLMNFEKTMKRYGVKYNSHLLHNSMYDAQCLLNLFCVMKKFYKGCEGFTRKCFIRTTDSYIIHSPQCRYLEKTDFDSIVTVNAMKMFDAYKNCCICGGCATKVIQKNNVLNNGVIIKNPAILPFTDEDIEAFCARLGLNCKLSNGVVFIRTPISSWRIFHNYEKVDEVFHENYRGVLQKRREKFNTGYHRQNVTSSDIWQILKYIYNHDKRYITTVIGQKSRVDVLLEQIEKETVFEYNNYDEE